MFRATCPACKVSYPLTSAMRAGEKIVMVCSNCKAQFSVLPRMMLGFMFPKRVLKVAPTKPS